MITEFKIFEKKVEKKWYINIINNDLVKSMYNQLKSLNIKGYYYPFKDEMFVIIHITKEEEKLIPIEKWLESDYIEKRTFARENDSINIEKWLKEYPRIKKAKKYNI